MRVGAKAAFVVLAGLLGSGCPDKEAGRGENLLDDASFGPRVFRPPPSGPVRALPPHNIHKNGVGPYALSASLQDTLALLPSGPRVELFEAEGLFDYRLMRSDGDALLLGVGRRGGVSFISVLDPDIARTENGIGVGAGVQELVGALGALRSPDNSERDPRIITFTALPDTRFIVEKGRVVAAVVMPPILPESEGASTDAPSKTDDTSKPSCKVDELEERRPEILKLAKESKFSGEETGAVSIRLACLTPERAGALVRQGDAVAWTAPDPSSGELRIQATTQVPGLSFVGVLDTGGGKPEIFAVSEQRSSLSREVVLSRLTLAGARLASTWSRVAFSLDARTAAWIGARMQDADFLVEVAGRDGAVSVGGIYLDRGKGALQHVVPLSRIELPVGRDTRKGQGMGTGIDAGASRSDRDAGPAHANP